MSGKAFIILIIANLPIYWAIGWAIFRDCVRFWFTPNIISLFNGEYMDDIWAELRLAFWAACCAAAVYGEYWLIGRIILRETG